MASPAMRTRVWTFAAALTACALSVVPAAEAGTAALTREAQAKITPANAIEMLQEGNLRFVSGESFERDYMAQVKQTASGQYPFAAVVSCLDSRIPPEIVFDQGIGDLFVARVAGNFVNEDILGSLEFATKVVGAKLVVIMGHTECGAVKGACDGVELGLLTATLADINPAVTAVQGDYEPRSSENAEFVHAVTVKHVQLTMERLLNWSTTMRRLVNSGELALVGAIYDIETGRIEFLEAE